MENVKKHFEEEAHEFDKTIERYIPYYKQMIRTMVETIPLPRDGFLRMFDVGSGTGNIILEIKRVFPYAHVTGMDFSERMIELAKHKLENYTSVDFIHGDMTVTGFPQCCDAVVSSLAMHHLRTDEDRLKIYKEVFHCLNRGGYFFNADLVMGAGKELNDLIQQEWRKYLRKSFTEEQIENDVLVKYRDEDFPVSIERHLELLKESGFIDRDVIWKWNNFAVYGGRKPPR